MTREEAIYRLKNMAWLYGSTEREQNIEAIDMAIEALHREEAEEKGYCHRIIPSNVEVVVRCKDCYHAEDDITHMYCVYFGHKVYGDDYCSNAVERREP